MGTADPHPSLTAADLSAFLNPRITPEVLAENAILRVADMEARRDYGIRFDAAKDVGGILFPYFSPVTGRRTTCRVRRDHPEMVDGKIENKYLAPWGDARHLYISPMVVPLLEQLDVLVVLVEAEKSALALIAWARRMGVKMIVIALGGCWGWRGPIGIEENVHGEREVKRGPLPDLSYCNGHPVCVLLDANVATNEKVRHARSALVAELQKKKRGCTVLVADLPLIAGVNGPDDYVAVCGDAAMKAVLAGAHAPSTKAAQRQATTESAQDKTAPEYSHDAVALKFTEQNGDRLRFTDAWGRWNMWNDRVWGPDKTCHVFDLARAVCRAESTKCENLALARKIASAPTVYAVERFARADRRHAATVEQWDTDPWLLNTPDGVVDLRTGARRPARREDYITKITAVGPSDRCPLWLSFLDRITNSNRALQGFLQRMCGYALTGITHEHALFFFFGTGANGKTVFLNTISGLMGDYAEPASIDTFLESRNERHPTELAWLQGARLVTAVETEEGRRWSEAKLKMLTGGDPIAARFMRQDFFKYTPQFKPFFAGNHKPGLRTVDEAARRRINLVPFTVTIPESERDPELGDKLREEWPGILGWGIEGCLAWQTDGLNAPDAVKEATGDYLAAEDVIGRWLEDRCEAKPGAWEPVSAVSALLTDYRQWIEANGEYAVSMKEFSEKLESRGFIRKRKSTARLYRGIALRNAGPVTGVTGSPDIGVTRTHARECPNKEDLAHPSSGRSNSRSAAEKPDRSAPTPDGEGIFEPTIFAADVPLSDQPATKSASGEGLFIDVEA